MEFNSRVRQHQDLADNASVQMGRAQDAVECQDSRSDLELETRLSLEVTPAMNVWPWLVRHDGWLLEKVSRGRQQEDSVRRLFRETVPRRGDEIRGGSSVPCGQWKDSRWNQTG